MLYDRDDVLEKLGCREFVNGMEMLEDSEERKRKGYNELQGYSVLEKGVDYVKKVSVEEDLQGYRIAEARSEEVPEKISEITPKLYSVKDILPFTENNYIRVDVVKTDVEDSMEGKEVTRELAEEAVKKLDENIEKQDSLTAWGSRNADRDLFYQAFRRK